MKIKIRKTLPKTDLEIRNGGLYLQRVKCGKPNCKCGDGERHSAYYFFTRINGKLTKTYVPKSKLKEFEMLVEKAVSRRKVFRQINKSNNNLLKKIRNHLRERNSLINSLKGDNRNV